MTIRRKRLATSLLATTAVVVCVAEFGSNLVARGELRAFLDQHPNVSVAGLFAEPFTGRVFLRGIAVESGSTRVTVGRLDLPLSPTLGADLVSNIGLVSSATASPFDDESEEKSPDEAPAEKKAEPAPEAKTTSSTADDLTMTNGQTTVRIKRMEMTGTSLTKADFAAIIDPKSTEPAEARFKKLTASAIVIPEITIDDTSGGSERHATISQVLLSGATEGKIAAGSTGRTIFTVKTGQETNEGEIGATQASNVDLVQFARVFNSIRSDDAEPIRPLYDAVTVTGLKITDIAKKSTLSLGTLRETGLKARPLATNFITGARERTTKLSDAESKAAAEDMLNSIEIGSLEANDLVVRTDDKDGINNFSLASVNLHDLAKHKIGGFTLRALRFEGAQAKFGIGSFEIGAFQIPSAKTLPSSPQDSSSLVPVNAKIDVNQIDFDGVTKDKDDPQKRIQFKLNHIGLVSDGEQGDIPKASKLTVDNLVFDVPPDAGQASALIDMGYKRLDMSAAVSTTYNPGAQELTLDNFSVNGVDMGTVGIGLQLTNVSKGIVSPNKEIAKASALAILVKGLKLDVINAGLFDRALAWKAKQDGMSVDQERTQAVDFFANKLPASMNNHPNVKKVGEAVAKFVTAPKGLHISILSKNGLGAASMGMLADPNLLLDTLDVKATTD